MPYDKLASAYGISQYDCNLILSASTLATILQSKSILYSLTVHAIKFIVVTQYAAPFKDMGALLIPFESEVWWGLIVFGALISIIISLNQNTTTSLEILIQGTRNFISVYAYLLRQTGGDWLTKFTRKSSGMYIVAVWLLCGCLLVTDNLYTGSIFSILSAPKHPRVPERFDELVNSDLQIMTTGTNYVGDSKEKRSTLSDVFIPNLLKYLDSKPQLNNFIHTQDKKLVFVADGNWGVKLHEFVRSISESRKLSKLGFDTAHTFAIMDSNTDIRPVQTWLRLNGKRLIIDSKEDTPFVMVWLTLGFKNCFHPMLSKWFAYFSASGIENKLEHQEWMRELFKRLIN
ncbi:hypothetical protein Fcan01_24402 [Folsomia candida]|uniref:Uncharacterized protein n=1 Tax=Folsomia candida TaxID=158441 RepID=A0A226D8F1_FOLCA|nr:hypothetical protein Fcan01_24402 [Folsomia candida]